VSALSHKISEKNAQNKKKVPRNPVDPLFIQEKRFEETKKIRTFISPIVRRGHLLCLSPHQHLRLSDGPLLGQLSSALSAVEMDLLLLIGSLLDSLLTLGHDNLDVAWVGHVWVDLGVVLAPSLFCRKNKLVDG